MKKVFVKFFVVFVASLFVAPVFAEDIKLEEARKNIVKHFKGVNPSNIFSSPVSGLYQVFMPPRFFVLWYVHPLYKD